MAGFYALRAREHDRPCRLRSPAAPSAPRPRHPPHGTHPGRHSPHQHPPLYPSTTPNSSSTAAATCPKPPSPPTPLGCRLGGETLRQSRQGTLVSVPACLGARLFHNFKQFGLLSAHPRRVVVLLPFGGSRVVVLCWQKGLCAPIWRQCGRTQACCEAWHSWIGSRRARDASRRRNLACDPIRACCPWRP